MSEKTRFPAPNLGDYNEFYSQFNWQTIADQLSGLPNGKGLNIAHEAIDRHAAGPLKDTAALRWVRKSANRREETSNCTQSDGKMESRSLIG